MRMAKHNNPNAKGVTPNGLAPRKWDRRRQAVNDMKRSLLSRKMKEEARLYKLNKRRMKKQQKRWSHSNQTDS
jgi:hypothetical protein